MSNYSAATSLGLANETVHDSSRTPCAGKTDDHVSDEPNASAAEQSTPSSKAASYPAKADGQRLQIPANSVKGLMVGGCWSLGQKPPEFLYIFADQLAVRMMMGRAFKCFQHAPTHC
jgi:hypothetical protein